VEKTAFSSSMPMLVPAAQVGGLELDAVSAILINSPVAPTRLGQLEISTQLTELVILEVTLVLDSRLAAQYGAPAKLRR
jgi:hypothetical protein